VPVVLQNIIRFVLLVLAQVLILNNIQFNGFVNPYLYVLFVLSLPVRTAKWVVLGLAFALGLIIDAFSNTMGMHAFATVLMAFLRAPVINLFTSLDEGSNPDPSFHSFGIGAYIRYAVALVLVHNITLFTLEAFNFINFGAILLKIALSSLITLLLVFGIQLTKQR
jgi:rod shape-determining protein MreD